MDPTADPLDLDASPGDVYDAAPSALLHDWSDSAGASEVSEGLGVEIFMEGFVSDALNARDRCLSEGTCSVVDQNIDTPELEVGSGDHTVDRFGIGSVALNGVDVSSSVSGDSEAVAWRVSVFRAQIAISQPSACEFPSNGFSNAPLPPVTIAFLSVSSRSILLTPLWIE